MPHEEFTSVRRRAWHERRGVHSTGSSGRRRRANAETIDWIHVRHEEVAAFAAAGESQLTGEFAEKVRKKVVLF